MSTKENLEAAFAGESQANRKYQFFAENADENGNIRLARLFRAVAEAETVHARNHLKALGGIKSDKENLEIAISGEHYEFASMYPGFIEVARKEKDNVALRSFELASKVEQVHHKLFEGMLKDLESGNAKTDKPFYVCQVCGYTVEGEAPERCPVCGAPRGRFKQID